MIGITHGRDLDVLTSRAADLTSASTDKTACPAASQGNELEPLVKVVNKRDERDPAAEILIRACITESSLGSVTGFIPSDRLCAVPADN